MKRRDFLKTGSLAAGAAAGLALPLNAFSKPQSAKRVLRIAHMTDIHVQPKGKAPYGMEAAFKAVHAEEGVDFILNGGDSIMDALGRTKSEVSEEWKLWHEILDSTLKLPMYNCLGNHDIWGWSLPKEPQKDPNYGKDWALDQFGMKGRYYSFDQGGWHFIVLDSMTHAKVRGYTALFGEEQLRWLREDLEGVNPQTPVCVLSHIPIICFCAFFDGDNEKSGRWNVPGAWMHLDGRQVKDIFKDFPNVKICLSGHIHLQDAVEYLGVKYLCNGAVCGGWWGGNYQEFPPAYVIVDLYEDGSSTHRVVPYAWQQGGK
ncbi:MAG: metallophosphoesterase [Bacteroidia bacterium]|nr:metallophosphoesterase [Bacteroidia bacterium]